MNVTAWRCAPIAPLVKCEWRVAAPASARRYGRAARTASSQPFPKRTSGSR